MPVVRCDSEPRHVQTGLVLQALHLTEFALTAIACSCAPGVHDYSTSRCFVLLTRSTPQWHSQLSDRSDHKTGQAVPRGSRPSYMIRSIVRPFVALFRARAAPMGRATGKNALMPRETTPAVTGCIAHRSIRLGEFGRTLRGNRCACLAMHTVRCSGRSSRGAGPSCRDLAILGCCGRCKIRRDRARISANVTMNSTGVIGRSVVSCGSGVVLCCTVAVSIPAPRMSWSNFQQV